MKTEEIKEFFKKLDKIVIDTDEEFNRLLEQNKFKHMSDCL